MLTVLGILILASIVIAIVSAVKPYPILWVAVLLLGIVEAFSHYGSGVIR